MLQAQDPEGQADDLGPVADHNEEGAAGQQQEGGAVPQQVAAAGPAVPQLTQVCARVRLTVCFGISEYKFNYPVQQQFTAIV